MRINSESDLEFEFEFSVAVSLREISALMALARKLNSLIDIYFGSPGRQ